MADETQTTLGEIDVDTANLYLEEIFTDMQVATIRRLTPVDENGAPDPSRKVLFIGQAQLMSQVGPVPVQTVIEADTLKEAMAKFPAALREAVDQLMDEAREARRREASRIIHPGELQGSRRIIE